jgi:ATP-dependent protease ClpP protease subunit
MISSNTGNQKFFKRRDESLDRIHNNSIDVKNRTIYIHSGFDYEESGVDFKMATACVKNIDYLNSISHNPITLKMLSYGGCWNYGMAMYDAIVSSKSYTTFISYAHARSMSSIIPQAANKRLISKHCDFMIHYGTYEDSGDFRQVANGLKFTEKQNDVMLNIYASRCVKGKFFREKDMDQKKVFNFLKNKIERLTDWWMTSEEAVYYGFMDKVI